MTTTKLPQFSGDPESQIEDIISHLEGKQEPTSWADITAMHTLGRNAVPALLVDLLDADHGLGLYLDLSTLGDALEEAWTGAEFPERTLDRALWAKIFGWSGYIVDTTPRERPAEPLTLFRGAKPDAKAGMAWTGSLEQAQWFANRPMQFGEGKVYTATVEPERLFAHFPESRGEDEYVIDTDNLEITEYTNQLRGSTMTSATADIYSEDIRVEEFDEERIGADVMFSSDDVRPILSYQWNQRWDEISGELKRRSGQWVLTYNPDSPEVYETGIAGIDPSSVNDVLKACRNHLRDLAAHV